MRLGIVWTCIIVLIIAIVDTVHASTDSEREAVEQEAAAEEQRVIEILEDSAEDDFNN